jgi:NitT/TauT family transport system substrate-binding protein
VGVDSLRKDWAYYKEVKLIAGDVTVDQIIDDSFVAAALKDLGPYKPKR